MIPPRAALRPTRSTGPGTEHPKRLVHTESSLLRRNPCQSSSTDQGHLDGLDASQIVLLFPLFFNKQVCLSSDVAVDLVAKTSTCLMMLPGTFKLQQQIPDRVS